MVTALITAWLGCGNAAAATDASGDTVWVEGFVREWRPVPELAAHKLADASAPGPAPAPHSAALNVAADLNADGRDEIVSLERDALIVRELLGDGTVRTRRIAVPVHDGEQLLAGDFDADGNTELAIVLARHDSIRFVIVNGNLSDARFIERTSPVALSAGGAFTRLVDGYRHHEIVGVTAAPGNRTGTAVRLLVDSEFKLTSGPLALPGDSTWRLDGAVDPLGDGEQQILQAKTRWGVADPTKIRLPTWLMANIPGVEDAQSTGVVFAQLSERVGWGRDVIADFNGDMRDDVIVAPDGPTVAWILIATGQTAVEQPLPPGLRFSPRAFAGDFNGDGLADVLDPGQDGFTLYQSIAGAGISGATVECGSTTTRTDDHGRFRLAAESGGRCSVTAPGRVFVRDWLPVTVAAAHHRPLSFAARPAAPDHPAAAVTFGTAGPGPYVCTGYVPGPDVSGKWGRQLVCPRGYAFVEADDTTIVVGSCCRLPDDMLVGIGNWLENDHCPPDHVITGSRLRDNRQAELRCTKLRTERYRLGSPVAGRYWGVGLSAPEKRGGLSRLEIQPALREGVGRLTFATWDTDGCIGATPGFLMVGTVGAACNTMRFAPVLELGTGNIEGRIHQTVPDCAETESPFDPLAGCRR